jgi:uncharacterized membrane protein
VEARSAVTVNASPDELYAFWRDFERLPQFMYHLQSVEKVDEGRWHWVVKGPVGSNVGWDAELTEDVPGRKIAWGSVQGAVENFGSVRFDPAPGGQGTEVHVEVDYSAPGRAIGTLIAKLFGEDPTQQLADDLRRFKQIVETGEIARSDGSPLGSRTANIAHQEDAHPMEGGQAGEVRADAAQEQEAGV